MKKKIVLFLLTVSSVSILDLCSIDIQAATTGNAICYVEESQDESGITTRASDTEWRYKMIDGKLYKRLYDTKTQKWLTDWIPC